MTDQQPDAIDLIPPPRAVLERLARTLRAARLLRSQLRVSRRAAEECQQDAEDRQGVSRAD